MRLPATLALVLVAAAASPAAPQDAPSAPPAKPADARPAAVADAGDFAAEQAARRRAAAEKVGSDGVLLVLAAPQVDGLPGTNRNSDFEYLAPLLPREGVIVVAAAQPGAEGGAAVDRIYLPLRNPAMERWTGAEPGPDAETARAARFGEARALERLGEDLAVLLRTRSALRISATPPTAAEPVLARLAEALRAKMPEREIRVAEAPPGSRDEALEAMRKPLAATAPSEAPSPAPSTAPATPPAPGAGPPPSSDPSPAAGPAPAETAAPRPLEISSARPLLGEMRQTKSPAEIAKIRRAVAGTVAGHFDALRAARAGLYEYHVAAIVELRCRENGSLRQAYPSIVGSGPWSCVLHYDRNTRRMEDGDVVVLDAGGAFEGYASDVTRTFPVSGRFTEEQAKVYDAVLDAQERAIAAVRPGQTLRQVHEVARSALAERGLDKWFIHGTCHSVGLDVHDPWPKDAVLRPGAVITVEPGVYDPARNLGVRIEDTVLVTEKGCEVLSSALPKKREDVERLMREDPPAGLPR